MKIEAGKFYRTREGKKARIYATDGNGLDSSVHGAILLPRNQWGLCMWNENGRYFSDEENENDLVSEWVDKPEVDWSKMPAWASWVAMDKDGRWLWWSERPESGLGEWWLPSGDCGRIPGDYTPKFSGGWKDSLTGRD